MRGVGLLRRGGVTTKVPKVPCGADERRPRYVFLVKNDPQNHEIGEIYKNLEGKNEFEG